MTKHANPVDSYIGKSADFAKPILNHFRALVFEACPDAVETIKWGFPHFDYKGMMCSMAAFKEHCSFGFWKAALMKDTSLLEMAKSEAAMGHLGKIRSLRDLPSDKILKAYIQEAAKLNEDGVKVMKAKPSPKVPVKVPASFQRALGNNKKAKACFDSMSYSHRKEYVAWINEAKTEPTRNKRISTAIEWLSEGKSRNWKYAR